MQSLKTSLSRRRFSQLFGAALGGSFLLNPVSAQIESDTTIELTGQRSGWEGVAPSNIEGDLNPTLELIEGETYTLIWENGDGVGHNFIIEDEEGNNFVETELMSSLGETQEVEFTVNADMYEYYCQPHPAAMRGSIEVVPAGGDTVLVGQTDQPTNVTETSATLVGSLTDMQGYDSATGYFEWGEAGADLPNTTDSTTFQETGSYEVELTDLQSGTEYEYRFVVEAGEESATGNVVSFQTEAEGAPTREELIQQLTEESDFVFDGLTGGWEGLYPSSIEGETNPTIEFEVGQSYTLGWINADGAPHNIAIWDEDDNSLEATETVGEENATQTLTVEATEEMATYICEVHPTTMLGDIELSGVSEPTPTPTPSEPTPTPTSDDGGGGDGIPGFGVLGGLAGLAGGAALAGKRFFTDRNEEEDA